MTAVPHKTLISLLAALAVVAALAGIAQATQPKSYWLVSSTGQVFAYGKAKTHGSEAHKRFVGRITGIKGTVNGAGYWIITTKKHYDFGNASHYKYRSGGLKKYTGKTHPKGLRGKIVGYAVATIPAAKNGGGGTHTTTTPTPTPPTVTCNKTAIDTASLDTATATDPFSQTLAAGGVSGGNWTWGIKSGALPSGLSLSTSGVISGTPTSDTGGTQSTFTVQATNSQCATNPATRSYTLTVAVQALNITTPALNAGIYGEAYDQTMTATGGQVGDDQWSASGLPTGLLISSVGEITGSPTAYGSFDVQITVADSTGDTPAVSTYYTLSIALPPLEITSPSSLSAGQDSVAYTSVTFSATGGTAMEFPPQDRSGMYVWSAIGLPTGMSMSVHGVLSGTPTESGTYSVQVTVADASNNVPPLTETYTLSVALAPLQFTTTTLTATQDESYTGNVIARGGQSPYSISFLSGSLPAGLHFNDGNIYGTATATPGDYQFTVGVSDSQSSPATAQETFNMWVAPSETTPDLSVTASANNSVWAGYLEQASSAFTAVSGTLTVPTVQSTPENDVSPWVGIDGYGDGTVIQAGVAALATSSGTASYAAWWETYPANSPQNEFEPSPGDSVNVTIWEISSGRWEITLNDTTSGQGFAVQASYSGSGDTTAEWIVENSADAPAVGYAATSSFTNMAASQAGSGMLDLSTTGATPGALTSSGFSISDYN
jgi:hypothetical protein